MKAGYWSCALAAILLPRILAAQEQAKLVPALGWDRGTQGAFVTSVVVDLQNNVWAGTEGKGLWRYDAREKKWKQFTAKDGLGDDNVYALAVDKLGRVWAGHLNHGVSVWNGEKWKNYGLLDGPLGDRVFSIATCPTDGDVWIATDCGIARYSLAKDDWDYFTQAGGLPSNQIQGIAFDPKGNIFAGTQCDGVSTASAAEGYKKWTTIRGASPMPNTPVGEGMSSDLVNDITVVNLPELHGSPGILVATPVGMSLSHEGEWMFVRGADWQANMNGLYSPPPPPMGNVQVENPILLEDWVTCIRQDEKSGNVWIGHRKKGLEVRGVQKAEPVLQAGTDSDANFVRAICLPQKGPPLVAVGDITNGGLLTLDNSNAALEAGGEPPKAAPPLPGTPKPADAATFTALAKQVGLFKNEIKQGDGVYLGDDWRTGGDWVGRYGNAFTMLCGFDSDSTYKRVPGYEVSVGLGIHNKGGAPESHIQKDATDSPSVLYNPTLGRRSEAELNDLSCRRADYPPEWEGPDLWVDVQVPKGMHCVSLYFNNNDSQEGDGNNKFRDYDVQLLQWAEDKKAVQKSEPLARARVTDFRGGVYKQFMVSGPARYIVRVGRNHSFGTKLQGVFIDRLSEYDVEPKALPGFEGMDYGPATVKDRTPIENNAILSAAGDLWDTLDASFDKRGLAGLQFPLRIAAYRAAVAEHAPAELLDGWRWEIAIWTDEDRAAFQKAMGEAYKAYSKKDQPAK